MPPPDILQYAIEQVAARLGKLAFQIATASKGANGEVVHDLRVAIRRFDSSLAVFGSMFPEKETRKIRKRLRLLRKAAGLVRDRDIVLEFLAESGMKDDDPLWVKLAGERKVAENTLSKQLSAWNAKDSSRKWRSDLQLNVP